MSTDDKPLLTEWQTGRTGALFCRRPDEPATGYIDYARVEVWPESGNASMWTIFDDNRNCVMQGMAPTVDESKRAADAAARQWYTLPFSSGQPAAPPESTVGCTRPDGLLNVHPESETCAVCAPPPTAPESAERQGAEASLTAWFAAFVRDALAARGMSQADLAAKMGKTPAVISRALRSNLTLRTVVEMADALGYTVEGFVVAASPPPVAAAKERDPDSLPPDGYFNYDPPAPAAPLPAPASEGATAHPQPEATDSTFVAVVHIPPGELPPVSMTVGGQTVPFEVLEVEEQPDATGAEVLADLDALWYALEAGPVTGAARVDGRLRVERARAAVSRLQADNERLTAARTYVLPDGSALGDWIDRALIAGGGQ